MIQFYRRKEDSEREKKSVYNKSPKKNYYFATKFATEIGKIE